MGFLFSFSFFCSEAGSSGRGWQRERKEETGGKHGGARDGIVRKEEGKNFSMMKQSALLCDWIMLPPMGGPAPWQQALSPWGKLPYPSTPPYFSFPFYSHDPCVTQLQGPAYRLLDTCIQIKMKQKIGKTAEAIGVKAWITQLHLTHTAKLTHATKYGLEVSTQTHWVF